MKISLKNCNNITEGSFDLELHKLNIKYAYNGTGKSTIAKSIKAFAEGNQDEIKALTPYWSKGNELQPWMSTLQEYDEKIERVSIFNDTYVNSYVFKFDPDDAENKGKDEEFEVTTRDFEYTLSVFQKKMRSVENAPWQILDIDAVRKDFSAFVDKFLNRGKLRIHDAKHLNEMLRHLKKISKYLSPESNKKISEIQFPRESLNHVQRKFIVELGDQICRCYEKLNELKNISQINSNDVDLIVASVRKASTPPVLYPLLNQDWLSDVAQKTEKSIAEIRTFAEDLQQKAKEQEDFFCRLVETHGSEINDFLRSAGYNYKVALNREKGIVKMVLKSSLSDVKIRGAKQHLSYGECNAFAMVLFLYSTVAKLSGLIVLDDPISSFDGNKKFALLNLMFLSTKLLENSTVLLLTHDFTTVVDIVGLLGNRVGLDYEARFLSLEKGQCSVQEVVHNTLKEIPITQGDIKSFKTIACDHINSRNTDTLIKLVYLRRLIEFLGEKRGEKRLAYNMISSILHTKTALDIAAGSEVNRMNAEEKAEAIKQIRGYISSFDFDREWKRCHDRDALVKLYWSLHSNYEKIQVFRIICGPSMEGVVNDVIKKYIDETFHIENDSIFQLDPQKYDTVPLYIVEECDKRVNGKGI